MERNNVNENGRFKNLREDLEKECLYVSQIVTISQTRLFIDEPYLKFRITLQEREQPIEIPLEDRIRDIFSMLGVKSQEEMNGKRVICYSGINGRDFAIGSTEKDWVVNLYDKIRPYSKREMLLYYLDELLPDEKREAFCQK